jgi:predicted secreted protein
MNRSLSIVLTVAFFSIAAVSAGSICDNAPCENPINVSQGENFTISLESNTGSTGFNWWTQFDTGYLDLVDSASMPGNQGMMVGVPGKQVFTFNAKEAGSTDVMMLYLQPWVNGTIGQEKIYPVNIS